jgi:hypothetical protein
MIESQIGPLPVGLNELVSLSTAEAAVDLMEFWLPLESCNERAVGQLNVW